jgi:regulatory protein
VNVKLAAINLRSKALTYLARREYSQKEMVSKLELICDDRLAIKLVVEQLIQQDYLSDKRYIESYIQSKINKYSLKKIRYHLMQKIDDVELINKLLDQAPSDEINLIRQLINKKFGDHSNLSLELKAKIYRYLSAKGFSYDNIKQAMLKN